MATKPSHSLLLTLILAVIGLGQAQTYESVVVGHFPSPRTYVGVVYDGVDSVFIIGGQEEYVAKYGDVYQFNVTSHTLTRVGEILPDLLLMDTGTDGAGNYFILGGQNSHGEESKVYKFTSEAPQPVEVGNLPESESLHCTASDNSGSIYILGGYDWPVDVRRYDTATGNTTVVGELPLPLTTSTAAMVDGSIYTFGGMSIDIERMKDIMKFTPGDGSSELLSVKLPLGTQYARAVAVGTDIYITGGKLQYNLKLFRMYKFDTLTQTIVQLEVTNAPEVLAGHGAVYVEKLNRIYLFGGTTHTKELYYHETDEIRYIQL